MRIQKMENLNFVFAYLREKNINLTNIGSADILDGNQKIILGLMWTLITSFQVAEVDVEGVSGKDGLLLWVTRSLADYPTIEVKNFSSSWSDGMAFCALIHRFYPSLIDMTKLNPANATANVKLAFDVALQKFRIPQLLEVSAVAGKAKPDEKSIVTYVSLLFKEFASGMQKKKAVTTITKAVNIAQRHRELAAEYAQNASGLLEWQVQQVERFQTLSQPKRIPDIKAALANLLEYKKNEKPPREAQFVNVEGCAGRWIASCKNNKRDPPVFNPPLERLQETKAKLDELDSAYELKLRQDLESYQKTAVFLTRVVKELEKIESWAKEKDASGLFGDDLTVATTSEVEEKLESIAFIKEIELPRYKQLLASVVEHAEGLSSEHSETASTLVRVEAMKSFVNMVDGKVDSVKVQLDELLRAHQQMDAVVKDCKVLMRNLKYAIEQMDEEIESETKLEDLTLTKAGIIAAKDQFERVLVPKVQKAVVKENEELIAKKLILDEAGRTYDVSMIEKYNARVQNLLDSLEEKRAFFVEELTNVERRDEVCREFADLSARIKERCANLTQSINVVEGTLTEQFASMVKLRQKLFRSDTGIILEENVDETPETDEEKPEETAKPEEIPAEQETEKPEETTKAKEADKPEVTAQAEVSVTSEETDKPEETIKSAEAEKPEETAKVVEGAEVEKPAKLEVAAEVETPVKEEVAVEVEKPSKVELVAKSEEPVKAVKIDAAVKEISVVKTEEAEVKKEAAPSNELAPLTVDMEKLEEIHEEMERLHVYSNPYTTDTIQGLRAQYSSLENAVRDKVKSLEKEVALSKVGNLTTQQLKEIKEVFDHFDYDNDNFLARDEFIMACKGLGLSLNEDDCHDYFDKIDEDNNDEMTYEQFKDFCAEQLQSGSSRDDVSAAVDILTREELTLDMLEEQFDAAQVDFIKQNLAELVAADGKTIDNDKFTAFIFSH